MIKVLVNGCNGKMGQVLINELPLFPELTLIGGFDMHNNIVHNHSFPVYSNINDIIEKPDVIVDFSVPVSTLNILKYAITSKTAMVIATTGFSKAEFNEIQKASHIIPIFQSYNMSYNINLMKKIVAEAALSLKDADIEILDIHHNQKIDSPSGTAIELADSINSALGNKMKYTFTRHATHEKRKSNEIGFSSIRGGNIVGEHSVLFLGEYETFEIKHTSYSKSVYAQGALKACKFIVGKLPHLYTMDDLLT